MRRAASSDRALPRVLAAAARRPPPRGARGGRRGRAPRRARRPAASAARRARACRWRSSFFPARSSARRRRTATRMSWRLSGSRPSRVPGSCRSISRSWSRRRLRSSSIGESERSAASAREVLLRLGAGGSELSRDQVERVRARRREARSRPRRSGRALGRSSSTVTSSAVTSAVVPLRATSSPLRCVRSSATRLERPVAQMGLEKASNALGGCPGSRPSSSSRRASSAGSFSCQTLAAALGAAPERDPDRRRATRRARRSRRR